MFQQCTFKTFLTEAIMSPNNPQKTHVYVDGFNIYYGAVRKTPYKWLDLAKLSPLLVLLCAPSMRKWRGRTESDRTEANLLFLHQFQYIRQVSLAPPGSQRQLHLLPFHLAWRAQYR